MNLWHETSPGKNIPSEINTIIEINKGSKNKYEIDKETGLIALDRVMSTAQDFPFDYGFIPQSLWYDKDPMDVIVLTTYPLFPGTMASIRPVAMLNMVDSGSGDDKIVGVPTHDPRWDSVQDLKDINPHTLKEIEHFYSTYKKLQGKVVEVKGFSDAETARKAVLEGLALYKEKYPKRG